MTSSEPFAGIEQEVLGNPVDLGNGTNALSDLDSSRWNALEEPGVENDSDEVFHMYNPFHPAYHPDHSDDGFVLDNTNVFGNPYQNQLDELGAINDSNGWGDSMALGPTAEEPVPYVERPQGPEDMAALRPQGVPLQTDANQDEDEDTDEETDESMHEDTEPVTSRQFGFTQRDAHVFIMPSGDSDAAQLQQRVTNALVRFRIHRECKTVQWLHNAERVQQVQQHSLNMERAILKGVCDYTQNILPESDRTSGSLCTDNTAQSAADSILDMFEAPLKAHVLRVACLPFDTNVAEQRGEVLPDIDQLYEDLVYTGTSDEKFCKAVQQYVQSWPSKPSIYGMYVVCKHYHWPLSSNTLKRFLTATSNEARVRVLSSCVFTNRVSTEEPETRRETVQLRTARQMNQLLLPRVGALQLLHDVGELHQRANVCGRQCHLLVVCNNVHLMNRYTASNEYSRGNQTQDGQTHSELLMFNSSTAAASNANQSNTLVRLSPLQAILRGCTDSSVTQLGDSNRLVPSRMIPIKLPIDTNTTWSHVQDSIFWRAQQKIQTDYPKYHAISQRKLDIAWKKYNQSAVEEDSMDTATTVSQSRRRLDRELMRFTGSAWFLC